MSTAAMPHTVYLVATNPEITECKTCGGKHEFWSVNHVPIVVDDPAEFIKSADITGFVPVEHQPDKQVRWRDHLRRLRGES